jgi:hypothetical protein
MSDHCIVCFTRGGEKQMRELAKKDPRRALIIAALIAQVEENGWKLSTNSEAIKVLRNSTCIGEIRDVGSGGYRLFLFWHDTAAARELWVCRVLPKQDVVGRRRLNEVCDAVEKVRERFLREEK